MSESIEWATRRVADLNKKSWKRRRGELSASSICSRRVRGTCGDPVAVKPLSAFNYPQQTTGNVFLVVLSPTTRSDLYTCPCEASGHAFSYLSSLFCTVSGSLAQSDFLSWANVGPMQEVLHTECLTSHKRSSHVSRRLKQMGFIEN